MFSAIKACKVYWFPMSQPQTIGGNRVGMDLPEEPISENDVTVSLFMPALCNWPWLLDWFANVRQQAHRPLQVPEFVVGIDHRPKLETDPRARTPHCRLLRVLKSLASRLDQTPSCFAFTLQPINDLNSWSRFLGFERHFADDDRISESAEDG
mgnify:CR=1 FL=1